MTNESISLKIVSIDQIDLMMEEERMYEKLVSYAGVLAERVIAGDILTASDMKVPE